MNIINPYRFSAAGGVTDPTDIAGCQLWLDAEQGVYSDAGTTLANNNDTVQQWNDQSGNGYNVTQTSEALRPTLKTSGINSKDSVEFDVSDFMDGASPVVSPPNTIFAVFHITSSDTFGAVVYDSDANSRHNFFWNVAAGAYRASCQNAETTTQTTLSADYISSVIQNGASSSIHMNGADVGDGSVDLGTNDLDGITLGTVRAGLSADFYMRGQIAEVIVYDTALSTADRQAVETYLANKWGITI